MYAESLKAYAAKVGGLQVSEAMPCALEKADGSYRWQIVIRAGRAGDIAKAWRWIASVRPVPKAVSAYVDIDAFDLV